MTENETILQEAQRLIAGDRHNDYGPADECFGIIATYWNTYINYKIKTMVGDYNAITNPEGWVGGLPVISLHDVSALMMLFKMARVTTGCKKRDNYVDIAGYAALAEKLL